MMKLAIDTAVQKGSNFSDFIVFPPSREKGAEARKFNERGFHRNAVRFLYPSEIYVSRYRALLIDGTLERSGQYAGVEDSATLPVRVFAHNESGQSVGAGPAVMLGTHLTKAC